jgi:hypothetical protein
LFAATIVLAVICTHGSGCLVFRRAWATSYHLQERRAWSITLLVALVIAGRAIATPERANRGMGTLVTSAEEVDSYLVDHLPTCLDPIRIPTGVLISRWSS